MSPITKLRRKALKDVKRYGLLERTLQCDELMFQVVLQFIHC